jgi:hypothetical protein
MNTVEAARPPGADDTRVPAAASAALAAYALVSIGSNLHSNVRLLLGVPLIVAGFGAACLAASRRTPARAAWPLERAIAPLSALATVGLIAPAMDGSALWFTLAMRVYFALAIVLVGVFAASGPIGRRRTTAALVALAVALQFASPFGVHVAVDLWSWTQTAATALLHGVHPYTVIAPDLQRGGFDFGSEPNVYPYMPLTLLAVAPSVAWFGDYRFAIACCLPLTIFLLRKAGRALDTPAAYVDLLTIALVLQPFGTTITATGYIEPVLMAAAAAFVLFAATAARGVREATAFLLLPALKQYAAAPALLYVAMRGQMRSVAAGAAVAAATIAPFLLWRARPTLDGIFYFVREPFAFRTDSDSIAALVFALTGFQAPRSLAVLAQFVTAAAVYRPLHERGIEGLLLASALSLLASFLVAPQAFANYYYFAGALLLMSSLAAAAERRAG